MHKNWSSFYTPSTVANEIVQLIPFDYRPSIVIDICAGSGNFLEAVLRKWDVQAIGVDLYPHKSKLYKSYNIDALEFDQLNFLNFAQKKLVVANPPFGKLQQKVKTICKKHPNLQNEAIKTKRIETNMLISNMSLLNDGEVFASILPENIFSAKKFQYFKEMFLSYFDIVHISEPSKYFPGSEVKTRIFIGVYKSVCVVKPKKIMDKSFSNSKIIALRGIDNSKLIRNPKNNSIRKLSKVIHFSNETAELKISCYIQRDKFLDDRKIQANDLLVSRVGRNSGKIHRIKKSFIGKYASDYFYILKNVQHLLDDAVLVSLEQRFLTRVNGLTTKYLCKSDILEEISFIENKNNLF